MIHKIVIKLVQKRKILTYNRFITKSYSLFDKVTV